MRFNLLGLLLLTLLAGTYCESKLNEPAQPTQTENSAPIPHAKG